MAFLLGGIERAEFFARYWRRRPLLVRGGARGLVEPPVEPDELIAGAAAAEAAAPDRVRRDGDQLFLQQIDRFLPRLGGLVRSAAEAFELPDVWLDATVLGAGGSIGCHYDDSDNFVLQQQGVKVWRLCPPERVPLDERRRRMRKDPTVGSFYMPEDALEYRLEPGDLLYIPLLWPHWGESIGPSVSVSIVCNPRGDEAELAPLRAAPEEPPPPPEPRAPGPSAEPEPRDLGLDMDRVRALFADPPPLPDVAALVLPGLSPAAWRDLQALLARLYLKRLLVVAARLCPRLEDGAVRASFRAALHGLLRLPAEEIHAAVRRPELVAWIFSAHREEQFRYGPRFERLALHLASHLLPHLVRRPGVVPGGARLALVASGEASLDLLAARRTVRFGGPVPERLWATASGGELLLEAEGRVRGSLTPGDLDPAGGGARLETLPALAGGPILVSRHRFYDEYFPTSTPGVSPLLALDDAALRRFGARLEDGAALVRAFWPAAWDELAEHIVQIMPVEDRGLAPHNASVHAFRGLVTTSARPSYLGAHSLVHEAGHNKLSTLADLVLLVGEDDGAMLLSPFVDAPRPPINLVHGVFSFLQDVAVSRRLAGRVETVGGVELGPYAELQEGRIRAAAATLRREARLTEAGERLIAAAEEVLDG